MQETFKKIYSELKNFWEKIEKEKRKRLILLCVLLLVCLTVSIVLLSKKEYVVLYSELDVNEAGEIYQILKEMNVDVKIQGTGTIMVEDGIEEECRMNLASLGYPDSGIGYGIYMDNIDFGTSDSEKQKYMVFQMQDRLQNTIKTLKAVKSAIVTISMPEEDVFSFQDDKQPVTACVVIDLLPGNDLEPEQISSIEHLMVTSVGGLKKENLSIIDTNLNLLSSDSDDEFINTGTRFVLENELEDNYEKNILSMIEPLFGFGNVKVSARVILNFDKSTKQSIKYEPVIDDEGIASSINEIKEKLSEESTTDSMEIDDAQINSDSSTSREELQIDYKVNEIIETIENESGTISDLYLSVLINKEEIDDEIIEDVQELIAASAGVDTSFVTIKAIKFDENSELTDSIQDIISNQNKNNIFTGDFIIKLITCVFTFAILLLILLTFRKKKEKKNKKAVEDKQDFANEIKEIEIDKNPENYWRKEVGKFIDKRPEDAAQLLKKWIREN